MHAWIAAWLLVGVAQESAPVDGAPAAGDVTAQPAAAELPAAGIDLGDVGLGLAGGGAVLATSTVVAATLIEALNTPDQEGQPRNELLIEGSGLIATGLVSVGAAMMLVGGALIVDDVVFAPARAAPPTAE